jgi:tRNA nucleotidyltransferase/poly(A) polymerase
VTARTFQTLLRRPAVRALIDAAAAADSTECHLVGGALRDRALGLPVHDIDAVVSGRGLEIAERLAETMPARLVLLGGKEFAAYRLVGLAGDGEVVDLWDREEMPLLDDLARRDFTVNSIAWELRGDGGGAVIDPFGGLADLERRVLRATTPASFTGDPLRVLRLPRLLLRLPGFAADPETLTLARECSPRLPQVAAERIREEISLLFEHPEAHRGLALLVTLDLYPGLWLGRAGLPGQAGGAVAELEALPHRILDLRELDAGFAEEVDARAARLAATFAHLPEPLRHLQEFRDAGYLTRQAAADVALILTWKEPPDGEVERRRFLHRAGRLWPTAICRIGASLADISLWRAALAALVGLARRAGPALFDPPRLLSGADVQSRLDVPPGPEVGRALDAVRQAQIDGRIATREEAEALLDTLRPQP